MAGEQNAGLRLGGDAPESIIESRLAIGMQMRVGFVQQDQRRCVEASVGEDLNDLEHPRRRHVDCDLSIGGFDFDLNVAISLLIMIYYDACAWVATFEKLG